LARILDNENAEIPGFTVLGITGFASVTTASGFTGSEAVLGVAVGAIVSSFFSAGALTSVIEKVGFL
jgi:hypothetical protein